MQTFNIYSLNIDNLTISQVISYLTEYFAINGDCDIPDITSEWTGEVINSCTFYFNENKDTLYSLEQLFELFPYFKRLGTPCCNNI